MTRNSTDFAGLVTAFLTEHLPLHRGYSRNTILSYRDTLKLFLRFVIEEKNLSVKKFQISDFKRETVIEFLDWYRSGGASIAATNQRLAALKSFAEYAQLECVECLSPLMNIGTIKSSKSKEKEISFLSADQIALLINRPDLNNRTGFRHRVLMTLLYDTGCRVSELCNITLGDVFIGNHSTVRLHGKGNKYRTVIVSDETGRLVDNYIARYMQNKLSTDYLITNRHNQKISRDGVGYVISKYAHQIHLEDDSFPKHVHCHMLRHSKAMHMLAAGINIVYIRDFLGHEDISTTMIYAKADNRVKNEAISKLSIKVTEGANLSDWSKDSSLMDFLESLK